MAAEGYAEERYWSEANHHKLWQPGQLREVRYILDERKKLAHHLANWRSEPIDCGEPYHLANQPVVGINWYEALALARWLTEHLHSAGYLPKDWVIHLPNEAEWEKAARGGLSIPQSTLVRSLKDGLPAAPKTKIKKNRHPTRHYPWGDKADANRMNCKQSEIGKTNAVGAFSSGDSPYGVTELSGNMWEWTRSLWGDDPYQAQYIYPYQVTNGREDLIASVTTLRVLRGGSYYNQASLGRCSYRRRFAPGYWNSFFGLRLVAIPFADGG